jgi:hypothetical protein
MAGEEKPKREVFRPVNLENRGPGPAYTIACELPAERLIFDPTAGSGTVLAWAAEALRRSK